MPTFWNFLVFLVFAVCLVTSQKGIPTSEESIDELVSAGVSENAAAGIVKFDKKLQEPFEMEKTDPEGAKELEQVLHKEFTEYIENLSEYDQEAYQQFIKDKHAQLSIN
ncbi:hypothetical protein GCK72_019009 [Caenorhabditis remanei]|uniref:Uncharacterized protein n=1 Tax=Caenorhabditis remanei TaxID=31234 RepID=A0A2P4V684_CAERE|nr:hypothetical protein GCK72_019009 [Caenorhabditis remanei]KAF1752454.1 hypothetical protein GCK72_019009 [Caenorhabditis remanei]